MAHSPSTVLSEACDAHRAIQRSQRRNIAGPSQYWARTLQHVFSKYRGLSVLVYRYTQIVSYEQGARAIYLFTVVNRHAHTFTRVFFLYVCLMCVDVSSLERDARGMGGLNGLWVVVWAGRKESLYIEATHLVSCINSAAAVCKVLFCFTRTPVCVTKTLQSSAKFSSRLCPPSKSSI